MTDTPGPAREIDLNAMATAQTLQHDIVAAISRAVASGLPTGECIVALTVALCHVVGSNKPAGLNGEDYAHKFGQDVRNALLNRLDQIRNERIVGAVQDGQRGRGKR